MSVDDELARDVQDALAEIRAALRYLAESLEREAPQSAARPLRESVERIAVIEGRMVGRRSARPRPAIEQEGAKADHRLPPPDRSSA